MDKTVIGILIGAAITLIGTILKAYFDRSNLKLQHSDQEYNLRISKLETCHELVVLLIYGGERFVKDIRELKKSIENDEETVEQYQMYRNIERKFNDLKSHFKNDLAKITTITSIYGNELKELLENLNYEVKLLEEASERFLFNSEFNEKLLERQFMNFKNISQALLNGLELKANKNISDIQVISDNSISKK